MARLPRLDLPGTERGEPNGVRFTSPGDRAVKSDAIRDLCCPKSKTNTGTGWIMSLTPFWLAAFVQVDSSSG
jgi:hypothetical protein